MKPKHEFIQGTASQTSVRLPIPVGERWRIVHAQVAASNPGAGSEQIEMKITMGSVVLEFPGPVYAAADAHRVTWAPGSSTQNQDGLVTLNGAATVGTANLPLIWLEREAVVSFPGVNAGFDGNAILLVVERQS